MVGFTSYEDMCRHAEPTHPGPVFPGVSCLSKLSPLSHGCPMVFPTCHWMNHQMWIYLDTERGLLCKLMLSSATHLPSSMLSMN